LKTYKITARSRRGKNTKASLVSERVLSKRFTNQLRFFSEIRKYSWAHPRNDWLAFLLIIPPDTFRLKASKQKAPLRGPWIPLCSTHLILNVFSLLSQQSFKAATLQIPSTGKKRDTHQKNTNTDQQKIQFLLWWCNLVTKQTKKHLRSLFFWTVPRLGGPRRPKGVSL
jgi:hypothetical protein